MVYRRYVAVGDSTTEGVGDERPDGTLQGWADRLAAALSERPGGLSYANLAVRGRRTAQIRAEQADAALALHPDLVSAVVGVNDLVAGALDLAAFEQEVDGLFSTLSRAEATVVSSTLPDLTGMLPLPARLRAMIRERQQAMNAVLARQAAQHGVLLLPLADLPSATDRRVWRPDRLHPNPVGHALLADAMLQLLAGGPITVSATDEPGYGAVPYARPGLWPAVEWVLRYLVPRTVRRLRGRSTGDGRAPKLPAYIQLGHGQVSA